VQGLATMPKSEPNASTAESTPSRLRISRLTGSVVVMSKGRRVGASPRIIRWKLSRASIASSGGAMAVFYEAGVDR